MSSSAVSSRIRPPRPAAALARAALTAILAGEITPRTAPLTVIVSADAGRLLADLGGDVHDARQLARQLARAEARGTCDRLRTDLLGTGRLLIESVDRIASPRLERRIATLLDAAAAVAAVVCVSLATPPAAAGLDGALESRLSAGLVVTTGGSRPAPAGGPVSIAAVIRITARTLGLPIETLVGHDRHRSLVRNRSLAMYVARACTGMSLAAIGRHFGGRDHTTVMRGIRGIESRLGADPALTADVRGVLDALAGGTSFGRGAPGSDVDRVSARRARRSRRKTDATIR